MEDIGTWEIFVKKSTDGGASWLDGIQIPNSGDPDKIHMTIDITNSSYRNNIYVAYTDLALDPKPIKFSYSSDGGGCIFHAH